MNLRAWTVVLGVGLISSAAPCRAADQVKALTSDEIKKLVAQLGGADANVAKRVKKQLIEAGSAALEAVRAAAFTSDAEPVRRAANEIVEGIAMAARKRLDAEIAKLKAKQAQVYRITDDVLAHVFPANLVFVVRFPIYPVAVRPTAPLLAQNLFIVDREGQMDHITDFKGLNTFFSDNSRKVLSGKAAIYPARAWLAMGQELVQDGYFKFSIPDEEIKIGQAATGVKVVARAVVKTEKGNKGFLQVRLEYGLTGDLDTLGYAKELTRGERPK